MNLDRVTVAEHARARFMERFAEAKAWTDAHPSVLDTELLDRFDKAEYIGTNGPNDNGKGEVQLYIYEDMLLFFDTYRKKLITFVMVDFGFNPEINKDICRKQTAYIKELLALMLETESSNSGLKESLNDQVAEIDNEIASLELDLAAKRTRRRTLLSEIETLDKDLASIQSRYQKEVRKVQYSINFRIPDPSFDPQQMN